MSTRCPFNLFHFTFQAYHSSLVSSTQSVGNTAILPLKTQVKGPAPPCTTGTDIIDEALYYFRANVFFRTYEIKVIYLLSISIIILSILLTFYCKKLSIKISVRYIVQ